MCGIVGKLRFDGRTSDERFAISEATTLLAHRGPDGVGHWADPHLVLGHRRLSIIGLEGGSQPLSNETADVWVTFNGEIYNYEKLRASLEAGGHQFSTTTDTEVLVHLWEEKGVEMLADLRGMFSFAIWDQKSQVLFLARDRVGIKPLYWRASEDSLFFASELKAFLSDPDFQPTLRNAAVDRALRYDFLPGTATLLDGVNKLEPGHFLVANAKSRDIRVTRYWQLKFPAIAKHDTGPGAYEKSIDGLNTLLEEVVQDHLVADVPVGLFLSGGLDSTLLLSYMSEASPNPVQTFTIGFAGSRVTDERDWAKLAADAFGTDHHAITITPQQFADFLPAYVWHMEEPVVEPPAIALHFLSQLASRHVKAVISGEGGDEAFAGYSTYQRFSLFERLRKTVGPLRFPLAALGKRLVGRTAGNQASWIARAGSDIRDIYFSRTSHPYRWYAANFELLFTRDFLASIDERWSTEPSKTRFSEVQNCSLLSQLLYVDSTTWLPDDLLVKADKITMASSLELRVPFLDHRVLEFAAQLPDAFKVRKNVGKAILRELCSTRIPKQLVSRPKAGFPIPYDEWLRDELADFAGDVLLSRKTLERGMFRRDGLETLLSAHVEHGNLGKEVFMLLILELWIRTFLERRGPVTT